MIWIASIVSLYLFIGIITIVWQRKILTMEITGKYYKSKDSPKFQLALTIILTLGVTIWPSILTSKNRKMHRGMYMMEDVSAKFSSVSRDRGETLNPRELSLITSKFIKLYETFGLKMYEEHMKYELDKYREEGLREDYRG